MKDYYQRKYYKGLLIIAIICTLFALASVVFGLIKVIHDNQFNNNIFELIYMACHIIVMAFLIVLSSAALKNKPFLLKGLTIKSNTEVNNTAKFVGLGVGIFGVLFFAFSTLMMVGVIPNSFHFPTFLFLDMMNAAVTLIYVGFALFGFPHVYLKDIILDNINNKKGD